MVIMNLEYNKINDREYSLDEIIFHLEEIKMDKVCEGEYFPKLGTWFDSLLCYLRCIISMSGFKKYF